MNDGATPSSPNEIVNNDPCIRITADLDDFGNPTGAVTTHHIGDHDYLWRWRAGEMHDLQCNTCLKVKP